MIDDESAAHRIVNTLEERASTFVERNETHSVRMKGQLFAPLKNDALVDGKCELAPSEKGDETSLAHARYAQRRGVDVDRVR